MIFDQPLIAGFACHRVARNRIGDRPADDNETEARVDVIGTGEFQRAYLGSRGRSTFSQS